MYSTTKLIYLKASSLENHLMMATVMQERDKNIPVSARMREAREKHRVNPLNGNLQNTVDKVQHHLHSNITRETLD